MSAPSMPPDNSAQVEQMRIAAQERAKAEERQVMEQKKQQLAELRGQSGTAARGAADTYFQGRGVNAADYASDIDALINSTMAGIGPDDPNPGSYFTNFGQTAYDRAQEGFRSKNMREVDKLFAPNFETSRIPFTLDDPYLSAIEAENRASADDIIRNMLDRKVITPTGYAAAQQDLDKQAPGVKTRLNEIGTTTLSEGQTGLKNVAGKARQTASTADLGSVFDAGTYGSEGDAFFNDFVTNLGNVIRGKAPKTLFNTAGLGALAGAAQGAQNLPFDPAAMAGQAKEDDEDEDQTAESVF